jgi:hypothetical protein
MKKLLLVATLTIGLLSSTIPAQAASNKYYYITGTTKNYTQTITYEDGTTYTCKGIEIHDTDGNVWIWEGDYNPETDGTFKDGQKVKVKMNACGTKSKHDDVIVSINKDK